MQEGKGEIRYNIRQHSYAWQSLGNSVTIYFFKVYLYQVGMSGRFVLPYPRVRIKSVAQGCENLPPVAI